MWQALENRIVVLERKLQESRSLGQNDPLALPPPNPTQAVASTQVSPPIHQDEETLVLSTATEHNTPLPLTRQRPHHHTMKKNWQPKRRLSRRPRKDIKRPRRKSTVSMSRLKTKKPNYSTNSTQGLPNIRKLSKRWKKKLQLLLRLPTTNRRPSSMIWKHRVRLLFRQPMRYQLPRSMR